MRKRGTTLAQFFVLLYATLGVLAGVWFEGYLSEQSASVEELAALSTPTPIAGTLRFQILSEIPFEDSTESAPAHQGTPIVLQPLSPTPTVLPTEVAPAYQELPSQVIDGLLTYGQEQPLTEEDLTALIEFFNADPLTVEEDTYYATFLASESVFQTFAQDEGESLQAYLVRHVAWMDRAFKVANPPVEGGLVARRFIILADGVFEDDWDVRGTDYGAHGLSDSDGSWSFIDRYCPKSCGFYNQELRLDTSLLHEWIHSIFHLPDHYGLDFHAGTDIHNVLEGIPEVWQSYWAGSRPDISHNDFAMGGSGYLLRHYSALELRDLRNRGITHDIERNRFEMGFKARVSQVSVLDFGSEVAGARVLIYQTQDCPEGGIPLDYLDPAAYACKILAPDPVLDGRLDERGRIAVGNLFARYEIKVPIKEGVLFIKVTKDYETWFRWMDIRDFRLAYLYGFTNSVLMRVRLISASDDPAQFDWTILYEEAETIDEPIIPLE